MITMIMNWKGKYDDDIIDTTDSNNNYDKKNIKWWEVCEKKKKWLWGKY